MTDYYALIPAYIDLKLIAEFVKKSASKGKIIQKDKNHYEVAYTDEYGDKYRMYLDGFQGDYHMISCTGAEGNVLELNKVIKQFGGMLLKDN
jgi:hypothetical protein